MNKNVKCKALEVVLSQNTVRVIGREELDTNDIFIKKSQS
jgi:hypothetical protein